MTTDEKIKHLYEYVVRLRRRVDVLEVITEELTRFREDVMRTIMKPKPADEDVTKND